MPDGTTEKTKRPLGRGDRPPAPGGPGAFRRLIDRVGPCLLEPRPDRFGTLVRAIIGQQISSKAAASIDERLRTLGGRAARARGLARARARQASRSVGLSGVKARYVLNLAEAVASGAVPLDEFDAWDDDAIVASLTSIKGIGVWTAEMFLIFALNRPDVLPVGDLGVRVGSATATAWPSSPSPSECRALAEPWRPYRTIAIWYLWKVGDTPRPETRHLRRCGQRTNPPVAMNADTLHATLPGRDAMTFDLILKNGWVIDGTGGPPSGPTSALLDTMIAEVGRLDGAEARRCSTSPAATSSPASSTPTSTAT